MIDKYSSEDPNERRNRLKRFAHKATGTLAVAALALTGNALLRSAGDSPHPQEIRISVHDGDTLSDIASDICIDKNVPYSKVQDRVVDIQIANGLNSDQIHDGQVLELPIDICES